MTQTIEQLQARIAELEAENTRLFKAGERILEEKHKAIASEREVWEQLATAAATAVQQYKEEVLKLAGEIPVGDRFQDETKFRKLGEGAGDILYEVWGSAVRKFISDQVIAATARLEAEVKLLKTTPAHKRQDLHCVVSDIADECNELRQQLAAAQLRIKQLEESKNENPTT